MKDFDIELANWFDKGSGFRGNALDYFDDLYISRYKPTDGRDTCEANAPVFVNFVVGFSRLQDQSSVATKA
jgi:hypothetical protein